MAQGQIISVLVVDDEAEMRTVLSKILNDEGYSVEMAQNGKQAVKICHETPFDVALVDIELPDIKGTELLLRLKEIQPKLIVIIVTGHASVENAVEAVNEKADGYILKPLNVPVLLKTIKKALAEKTNAYFQMFTEVERAKQSTPLFKYQHPDKW
jgi:two-component system, NtrC family, response regulator HydG